MEDNEEFGFNPEGSGETYCKVLSRGMTLDLCFGNITDSNTENGWERGQSGNSDEGEKWLRSKIRQRSGKLREF